MDPKVLLEKAKAFARAETVKMLLLSGNEKPMTTLTLASYTQALQFPASFPQQTINSIFATCKIYIGSLHSEIQEAHLRQIFSTYGSIRSLSMSFDSLTGWGEAKHKGFAFLEFDFPEAGVLAMEALDGVEFGGRAIKVCRPKDFNTGHLAVIPKAPAERIFVANVNEIVDEEMIKGIFDAFGEVEKVSLLPDPITRKHRGCGYIQFKLASCAANAVKSIKEQGGLELAGAKLHVLQAMVGGDLMPGMDALVGIPEVPESVKIAAKQATSGKIIMPLPNNAAAQVHTLPTLPSESAAALALKAAVAAAKAKMAEETSSLDDEKTAISRYDLMQKMMRREDMPDRGREEGGESKRVKLDSGNAAAAGGIRSCVLVLRNMVTVEDAQDDGLEGEIREECMKSGNVEQVRIGSHDGKESHETVDVVVRFASERDAENTRAALNGRFFAGRKIVAEFVEQ
ncbi:hypothetical protein HDU98_008136 [Podochytrium sp. JEL0797]|nr:hypothetical protein HDU98_008136 [Podochytrium sp. JEL0797]